MIEEHAFFNYGASLNDTFKIFVSFKHQKPRDNSQIVNVGLTRWSSRSTPSTSTTC